MDVRENAIQALKKLPERPENAQTDLKSNGIKGSTSAVYPFERGKNSGGQYGQGATYQPNPSYRKMRYRSSSSASSQGSLAALPRYSHLKGLGLS